MDTVNRGDRRQLPVWFTRLSRYSWGFIGIAAAFAFLVAGVGLLRELVIPLVLAAFFAVVLQPAVDWLADRKIPEAIAQMKSLRELQMQSTSITKLPAALGELPKQRGPVK